MTTLGSLEKLGKEIVRRKILQVRRFCYTGRSSVEPSCVEKLAIGAACIAQDILGDAASPKEIVLEGSKLFESWLKGEEYHNSLGLGEIGKPKGMVGPRT